MFLYQTFRDYIKKLAIVDDTLEKLGTITDYYKLYMRTVWLILGWLLIIVLITYEEIQFLKTNDYLEAAIYISFMRNYCILMNVLGDLIITSILELVLIFTYKSIFY